MISDEELRAATMAEEAMQFRADWLEVSQENARLLDRLKAAEAEIERLQKSNAEVMCRVLANTPPDEWLSKAAIHDALKAWRISQ